MLPKAHRVSGVTPRNCRWFEGISRTDAWTCCWLEILTAQKPAASPNCRAHDDLLTDVNAKTGTQEGRNAKTGRQEEGNAKTGRQEEGNAKAQRRKDAKGRKEIRKGIEKEGDRERRGWGKKGIEKEGDGEGRGWRRKGDGLWFSLAPLRLCVYFFAAFISSPRFISVRGLQTIDHAVNPILDEPLPKIDHQPESQVS